MTTLIGKSVKVPFLREVPIWTYGPVYNVFGEYVRDGWSPSTYGEWEFGSQPEAEAFLASR
jgi:hypothetical protein